MHHSLLPPKKVAHKYVNSSAIQSIGYDSEKKQLYIRFRENNSGSGGGVYKYFGVPPWVYYEFINTRSPGSYYHSHIKREGYISTRLE